MSKTMDVKKPMSSRVKGIEHTFDRNGALVVSAHALLTNRSFLGQINAAVKLNRLQERVRAHEAAKKKSAAV